MPATRTRRCWTSPSSTCHWRTSGCRKWPDERPAATSASRGDVAAGTGCQGSGRPGGSDRCARSVGFGARAVDAVVVAAGQRGLQGHLHRQLRGNRHRSHTGQTLAPAGGCAARVTCWFRRTALTLVASPVTYPQTSSIAPVTADPPDAPAAGGDPGDEVPSVEGEISRSAGLGPSERVIPTWTDPTVRRASDAIGGPMGRHALVGRASLLTPLRVCLLMAIVVLICGWLFKAACIQQGPNGAGGVTLDQGGQRPWITACYNDAVPLYGSHGLDTLALPYATSWQDNDQTKYMEYPVVTGYWMWAMAQLASRYMAFAKATGVLPVPLNVAAYFTIGAIFLGLMYLWAVAATAKTARRRIWDTAIMCLSPLLIVHAFTNWDLLAIGFTAGAMLAWAREKPILAGALFGVGTAAKLYPILLLGPLLILCLRAGKMAAWTRTFAAAAVVWLAINLPVKLAYPDGWFACIKLNSERPPEYDSWYYIYATLTRSTIWDAAPGADSPTLVNVVSLVLFLLTCVAIGWLGLSARRPRSST